jgi:VanZ family protein
MMTGSNWPNRVPRITPAVLWMALIFGLSSQQEFPSAGSISVDFQAMFAHVFLFGTLAVLLMFGLEHLRHRMRGFEWIVIAFVTLYGISDEFHQSFVPGRTPSAADVLTDMLAAFVAVLIVQRVREWRQADK